MEARQPKVGIIVLHYKNWKDTIECLESLSHVEYQNYTMIVVDNGSGDGSGENIRSWARGDLIVESGFVAFNTKSGPFMMIEYDRIEAERGGNIELETKFAGNSSNRRIVFIRNAKNLGFSGGNNVGAKYASKKGCDYIVLLNNDTVILEKDFLNKMICAFEDNEEIFVMGPKIVTPSGDHDGPYIYETFWGELMGLTLRNQLNKLLRRPPVYIDMEAIASGKPVPVYKISGACMVFKTSFLEEIGYLDENVWLSCEEAIIAEQAIKKGGKVYFQPLTGIIHKRAQSPRANGSSFGILKNHFEQRQYFLKTYRNYGFLKMMSIKTIHNLRLYFERIIA